jgi:hypothetical protein
MQRAGLDAFGPAFTQPVEVPLGGRQLDIAQAGFLGEQLACLVDVARQSRCGAP